MTASPTDSEILARIGRCIAAARARANMTQAELAEVMSVDPVTVSRWETGARSPSLVALARLIDVLDLDPFDLFAVRKGSSAVAQRATRLLDHLTEEQMRTAVKILKALAEP